MSITYTASIPTAPSTLQDGVLDPNNNNLYIIESSTPSWRSYNTSTYQFIASSTTLSTPAAICMVNAASCVIASSGVTTVDFIEVSSGYRTNVAGGLTVFNSVAKSQRGAGDINSGVAMFTSSTAGKVVKVTSAFTVSQITLPTAQNWIPSTIILKSTGRWLVGGRFGKIYEIDSNGNIQDELQVTLTPNTGLLSTTNLGALSPVSINSMSYDNNLLLVATTNSLHCYDYSTKTLLWQIPLARTSNEYDTILCASSSGESLLSFLNNTNTENNTVQEIDFTVQPVNMRSILFTNSTNKIVSLGMSNTIGFALQQTSEQLRLFTVTPRASTTRVFTNTLNGVPQYFRLILLDDTGGVGTSFVLLDTYALSPATYRVPTGRTIREIVKIGLGTNAVWAINSYNT